MTELIPVSKDGVYLEVNPAALAQHKAIGWRECAKQEIAEADEKVAMSKAELQAALDEKGIVHKPAMSKAELQSLLDLKEIQKFARE